MRPQKPFSGAALATKNGDAEQVVEPAAVGADHGHIAARQERLERKAALDPALPNRGAGPAVRAQRQPDLDVEVFGGKSAERCLAIAFGLDELVGEELLVD